MRKILCKALVSLLCFGAALSAHADGGKAPAYAVVSLIGDQLTIAVYGGGTGTTMSPTRKEIVPLATPDFDDAAVLGAADAIKQQALGSAFKLYSTNDKDLYKLQDGLFGDDDKGAAARAVIGKIIGDAPSDYVIVLTKYKSLAHMKMPTLNLYIGSGDLTGIGYYVDDLKRVRSEEGQSGKGFLSSYAYVTATLLDAKTMKVVRSRPEVVSDTTVNLTSDVYSWNVLSETEKTESLRRTVRTAAHDAVTHLLHGPETAAAN